MLADAFNLLGDIASTVIDVAAKNVGGLIDDAASILAYVAAITKDIITASGGQIPSWLTIIISLVDMFVNIAQSLRVVMDVISFFFGGGLANALEAKTKDLAKNLVDAVNRKFYFCIEISGSKVHIKKESTMVVFKRFFLISVFIAIMLIILLDIIHEFYISWYITMVLIIVNLIFDSKNKIPIVRELFRSKMERRKKIIEITSSAELLGSWLFFLGFSLVSGIYRFDNSSLFSSSHLFLGIFATIAAIVLLSLSTCKILVMVNMKLRSK